MYESLENTVVAPQPAVAKAKLRNFVNAYWLRPENAMWMYLRSRTLDAVPFQSPSIDLCCGDGVFSFLHAGGRFDQEFDVFASVDDLDAVAESNADMFDHVDDAYQPRTTPARFHVDCGLDGKRALLAKADRLGFYKTLRLHDANQRLPFDDDSFATAYCNAAYWIECVEDFLSELHRITLPGGTIVLHVKLDAIADHTLEKHRDLLGTRWLATINRGRFDCWPTLADRGTWERRFENAGLVIVAEEPFITGTHAHIWNVGLRPIAPLLTKAMNAIHPHLRTEIKRDWVQLFCDLLEPFAVPDIDLGSTSGEPVEIQYVLTPTK